MYEYQAHCTNVVDGDTIDVVIDLGFSISHTLRVRLAGIDTPERGQAGYQLAKETLRSLVLDQDLTIRTQKDRQEKFGRYLAELVLPATGQLVNQVLLDQGLAQPYNGGKRTLVADVLMTDEVAIPNAAGARKTATRQS